MVKRSRGTNEALFVRSLTAIFLGLAGARAQLPTGVTLVPFYNTSQVSFARDSVRLTGMWEVPGKPQHFFVLDQMGAVYSLYPDTTKAYAPGAIKDYAKATLADFKNKVKHNLRSEMGAWSLAFHPNFVQNRYFYIMYFGYNTTPSDVLRSDGYVNVERWIVNPDYRSVTRDTTVYQFYHQPSYGVSSIAFGPDGYLYIATSVYSQRGWSDTTVARKILRIDVDHQDPGKMHAIPPTNPLFTSTKAGVKKEIYALGLRNVWSMSFNFQTGKLWAGDVGQTRFEEINIIQPGRNYGYDDAGNSEPQVETHGVEGPCPGGYTAGGGGGIPSSAGTVPANYRSGTSTAIPGTTCADLTNPDWAFGHNTTDTGMYCIVIGPAFRGDSASPYYGYHFVTDVQTNKFWAIKEGPNGTRPRPQVVGQAPTSLPNGDGLTNTDGHNGIVNIAEDAYGNLYASPLSWYYSGSIGGTTNALPSGQKMFHEIYRLSHAQLIPRTTPRPATAVWGSPYAVARKKDRLLVHSAAGGMLNVPPGYAGVEVYDLLGKKVWSHRGPESSLRIPGDLPKGVLRARFLP